MRRFATVLVISGSLLAGSASPASAQVCANVRGAEVIAPTNLTCASARKLARAWVAGVRRDGRYDRTVFGFRCRNRPSSVEGDTVYCRKGSKRARWYPNIRR